MSEVRRIEWTTGAGKKARITVALETSETVYADGHLVTVPRCKMRTSVEVEGVGWQGAYIEDLRSRPEHPACKLGGVALCGRLAIRREPYEQYLAAVAELEATPEWQAKLAREAKGRAAAEAYEAHRLRVDNMMTLNGASN